MTEENQKTGRSDSTASTESNSSHNSANSFTPDTAPAKSSGSLNRFFSTFWQTLSHAVTYLCSPQYRENIQNLNDQVESIIQKGAGLTKEMQKKQIREISSTLKADNIQSFLQPTTEMPPIVRSIITKVDNSNAQLHSDLKTELDKQFQQLSEATKKFMPNRKQGLLNTQKDLYPKYIEKLCYAFHERRALLHEDKKDDGEKHIHAGECKTLLNEIKFCQQKLQTQNQNLENKVEQIKKFKPDIDKYFPNTPKK